MEPPSRSKAIILGFVVVIVWSTSWVLIKIGLRDIPPLTFAGLRYFLAFLFLLPFLSKKRIRKNISKFSKPVWVLVILLGVISYFLAQGAQFLSLKTLPATTVSLILNLTSPLVALISIYLISEKPTLQQWLGVVLNLAGVFLFFYPAGFSNGARAGFLFAIICFLSNSFGTIIGRKLNRNGTVDPLAITLVSMGIGSTIMLVTGLLWEGIPTINFTSAMIILVMAVINTAFTFTLWNYTLQTLTATESSIINGTMMVFIAILAWIFLGEIQNPRAIAGLVLAFIGALIVNIRFAKIKIA